MWLRGIKKALSTLLSNTMSEELDEIDLWMRFSTSIKSVLRDVNKEFSLCANYSKVHGELFGKQIETYHPVALILHIERALGYHQDLYVEGAGALYIKCPYWKEFLDKHLRNPRDFILQDNLFIILT